MQLRRLALASLLALVAGCAAVPSTPEPQSSPTATRDERTVPIEALNPDVHQETIDQTICVPGYTASVRPSTTYTNGVKAKLLREQLLPPASAGDYELDHRVPLALGGHPRALVNLMLQPWEGDDGAKRKDRLERVLQVRVCRRTLLLDDARRAVYFDWQGAYREFVDGR